MYHTISFVVNKDHDFYDYCNTSTQAVNNLRNAVLFRIRQVFTFVNKPFERLTTNELEIYNEIKNALSAMGEKYAMPTKEKPRLSYAFLNKLMRVTENQDFFCKNISKQTAQHVLQNTVSEMKSFYALRKMYFQNPSSLNGRPELPHYGKKGGNHTVTLTNQDCIVYETKDGGHEVKFPLNDKRFQLGNMLIPGRLMQVEIKPTHGIFVLLLTFNDGIDEVKSVSEKPTRICGIDLGVNNLAAITNNLGIPSLLFKGKIIKSVNRYYNKIYAGIQSKQTKGSPDKFKSTPESDALCLWRNNHIDDFMNKTAARIIDWCIDNKIDTIVIGINKNWKQEINIGKVNNQNFVQIPFLKFKKMIQYRAEAVGICIIEQEESYTSKASFFDNDYIPTYGIDDKDAHFSGKRCKKQRFYKTADGTVINADLNGSANIIRKAIPDAFDKCQPDFDNVWIYNHPDELYIERNKLLQWETRLSHESSKSKLKRLAKKQKLNVTPCMV